MRARGFTMIEMMIGISLLALLLLLAMPAFIEFTANTKVRNVTEGFLGGLRQAQLEAVRRNTSVKFAMTADGWQVRDADSDDVLKSEVVFEATAANHPKITTEPAGASEVTFTGLGRVAATDKDGNDLTPTTIAKIKVDPPDKIGTRSLGIAVSAPGGNLKMCDPDAKFQNLNPPDPLACPQPW